MKVLHVIDRLWGGGAEASLVAYLCFVGGVSDDEHAVVCLSGDEGSLKSAGGLGCTVWFGEENSQLGTADVRLVRRAVDEFSPDIVATTLVRSTFAVAASRCKVPVLATLTSSSFARDGARGLKARLGLELSHRLHGWILRHRVDRVHAVSESVKTAVTEAFHLPEGKVDVVHRGRVAPNHALNGGATAKRASIGVSDANVLVTMVAREHPVKNHELMIRALPLLIDRCPEVRLLLIGDRGSASADIDRLLIEGDLHQHVFRLGHRDDVSEWLEISDVFVLSSRAEGVPGAVLEAMAHHVPIVGTRVPGIVDALGEDYVGLVSPNSHTELAEKILWFVNNGTARAAAVHESGRRFRECFAMERCVAGMADLFEGVLKESRIRS